jgi:D-glycero-D-manno-heptose 1,7-bisphosphate phosphatase
VIGLFEHAFADFPRAGPENSIMIGDSLSDIEAGMRIGMATKFVVGEPSRRNPL